MRIKYLFVSLIAALCLICPAQSFARATLFHATKKAFAQKIRAKGLSPWKGKAGSRFGGSGFYAAGSAKTALKEKKGADAVIRLKTTKNFESRITNITRPNSKRIRALTNVKDMRGSVNKGIIGPKLGHKLGRQANRTGRVLRYLSAKDPGGVNYFIPRSVMKRNAPKFGGIREAAGGRYR